MAVRMDGSLAGIDWHRAKADLAADQWDNGRSVAALRRSFEQSQHVAFARDGERVVGTARCSLGFGHQPEFWSQVVGTWLDNGANG